MPPNPNADYRLIAEKLYDTNVKMLVEISKVQSEYGRWLIATVTAVHIGGAYFVGGLQNVPIETKIATLWVFVLGIMLILFSGLAAWWNWGANTLQRQRWADVNMLVNEDYWPRGRPARIIMITYWLALVLGLISAFCLPAAALVLTLNLPAPP